MRSSLSLFTLTPVLQKGKEVEKDKKGKEGVESGVVGVW